MHSHVRFAAAASLIAFGSIIGGGALVLVPPAVDRLLVARAGMSHPPAPCERQAWPHSDRDCLSVTPPPRDLPRIAAHGSLDAVTATTQIPAQAPAQVAAQVPIQVTAQVPIHVPAQAPSPVERAPEQPLPESRHAAAAPPESARPSFITEQGTPAPPLVAAKPPSAKPAVASQARAPEPRKTIRRDQTAKRSTAVKGSTAAAKRSTKEALGVVRRFGDALNDIPVRSYAADGRERMIVIRPTSVQDVYYYSVPR